jgi:DNA-binding Lrp family transcriptional regulator
MKAYVLITARHGTADKVAETLRKIKNVMSAECVYGRYDVIAIVESPEMKTLSRVVHQLQKQPQILHTETAFSHYAQDYESEISE